MKRSTYILLFCFCVFITKSLAQNEINLQELLNRLSQNHMGSINDVFSSEELLMLQAHFSEVNKTATTQNSDLLLNRRISSTKGNTPVIVTSIDAEELTIDNHGPSPISTFEGAGVARFDTSSNVYVIENNNTLHLRGVANNNYTNLGVIMNIPPGESITGAEQTSNGDIFLISTNGSNSSHLFSLNPGPGMPIATPIGGNNGLILPINLLRDGSDNLFTLDIDDDNVYGMDKNTGVATLIGNAGFDANFGQGAGYDVDTDLLLLAAFNATIGDSELRSLNSTTGLTTSLGTITPGIVDQFGWSGSYDADVLNTNDNNFYDFTFFPNPANDYLHFEASEIIDSVVISNLLGQELIKHSVLSVSDNLNISELPAGVYLLSASVNNKVSIYQFLKS